MRLNPVKIPGLVGPFIYDIDNASVVDATGRVVFTFGTYVTQATDKTLAQLILPVLNTPEAAPAPVFQGREEIREKVEEARRRSELEGTPWVTEGIEEALALLAEPEMKPGTVVREWTDEAGAYRLLYRNNGFLGIDFKDLDESVWLAASGADWVDHVAALLRLPLHLAAPAPEVPTFGPESAPLTVEEFERLPMGAKLIFGVGSSVRIIDFRTGIKFPITLWFEDERVVQTYSLVATLRPADHAAAVACGRIPADAATAAALRGGEGR